MALYTAMSPSGEMSFVMYTTGAPSVFTCAVSVFAAGAGAASSLAELAAQPAAKMPSTAAAAAPNFNAFFMFLLLSL